MSEQVTLIRDCEAVQIPAGSTMMLKAGEIVRIAQSLGGSYTVTTAQGFMVRIDGHNADAIGKEKTAPHEVKGTSEADVDRRVLGGDCSALPTWRVWVSGTCRGAA